MAKRTKLALVTVIILVGCVFAIPHFRHPTGDAAKSDSQSTAEKDVTDLTLKVGNDENAEKTADPIALRDVDSLKKHSVLIQHPVAPPSMQKKEEWKFPPISQFGANREPVPANSGSTRQVGLQPTRLLGDNIGQRITASDKLGNRGSATGSFAGNSQNSLMPQPLKNHKRFASQTMMKPTLTGRASRSTKDDGNWHRVVNGDTLEKLSQQYFGSPEQALMIFEANRQALFNPAILPIGLDLKIPVLDVARTNRQLPVNRASAKTANQPLNRTSASLQPFRPRPVGPAFSP